MVVWTEEMKVDLQHLWNVEGKSAREIAEIVSKKYNVALTKNSVIGAVHRANLAKRPSPINNAKDYTRPKSSATPRPYVKRAPKITIPQLREAKMAVIKSVKQESLPLPPPRPKRPTGRHSCLWPLWGPVGRPTHQYCGAKALEGGPYCEEHHSMAYKKAA